MKRLSSSDSLGALICPSSDEQSSPRTNSHVYGRDFRSVLDGLDEECCLDEVSLSSQNHISEKKRRLSVDQVKALEKNFELENKLEPERKVKLAQDLGLQPRQVAVWFQNRRARWKTKQLERDYSHLKANYDSLRITFEALHRDNESLLKQIKELKSNLQDKSEINDSSPPKENDKNSDQQRQQDLVVPFSDDDDVADTNTNTNMFDLETTTNDVVVFIDHFRDGSSDSDSSAVLNDDVKCDRMKNDAAADHMMRNDMSSDSPPLVVKIEEHNFFSGEETTCNFFSDEQAPTMPWYCSGDDQWN